MRCIKNLVSFYKRRINIPVTSKSLVLDIGSGDKPHWRADILLDKYISDEFGIQRSGSKEVIIKRPIFDADAENMPFKDKVFDYVICSHLLEHVINPDRVMQEIMRVGKSGYIEVPYEGVAKIQDFPSHLWFCKKEGDILTFTAKQKIAYDIEIDRFMQLAHPILCKNEEACIVQLFWSDKIDFKINGEANMEILDHAKFYETKIKRSNLMFTLRHIIINIIAMMFFLKRHNGKISYNSIIKESLQKQTDVFLAKAIYKI